MMLIKIKINKLKLIRPLVIVKILSKQVVQEVKSYFKDKLFNTLIYRNVKLSEAPSFGKPALLYDANSNGAKNYLSLTEEILQRVI